MENPFELILQRLDKIEQLIKQINLNTEILPQKDVMVIDELSAYLDLSKSYIYKLTSSNSIPYYKRGKRVYFKKVDIDKWVFSNRVKTNEEINQEAINYLLTRKRKI